MVYIYIMKKEKVAILILIVGILILIVAISVLTGAASFIGKNSIFIKKSAFSYEFTTIEKRDIETVVSSSGTLEPVGKVNVLAQMSGTVEKTYASFNDRVKKNQRLADLNTDILQIQEKSAQANYAKAKANYEHTLLEYKNSTTLFKKEMLSEFEYHSAKTNLEVKKADLINAEAALQEIQMKTTQYAFIHSPIDGIVLSKDIEEGDTVTSGNNVSSLYVLAESLEKMEVQASVDELDISKIFDKQEVRFSVDAYPGEVFLGTVREIRLLPETENNVISYPVIVDADNSGGKLLPGMTASIDFIAEKKTGVLAVLNQALRYQPTAAELGLPEEKNNKSSTNILGGNIGRLPGSRSPRSGTTPGTNQAAKAGFADAKTLWTVDKNNVLKPIRVKIGITDGTYTEIELLPARKNIEAKQNSQEDSNQVDKLNLEGLEVILKIKVL